ncbi:GNAT family N-acetyltransferase [Micromonospora sp. CPCC 206060]|uniref:GNAT family N-acetyltransferase n=1 Tax=Micromonospora sp. CPCC 206060 TaxID=3122406 RepID=UPI002FEE7333
MDPEPADVLARVEHFHDAVPRDAARAEDVGPLVLFVREGAGFPFYARPRIDGTAPPSAADIAAVRDRQRELGLPETFEWLHERQPGLLSVARSAGLTVLEAPLMVLDRAALPAPEQLSDVPVRVLSPSASDFGAALAVRRAVAAIGFGAPGTARGPAGPAERDATTVELTDEVLAEERIRARDGRRLSALAGTPQEGALASGMAMRVGAVAEIAGVATLPSARRRGLGAAVTAALAGRLLADGVDLVFLSAGSEEIARVYLRAGFRRIGTACIAGPTATLG